MSEYLLKADNLKMHFPIHGGIFWRKIGNVFAVDGVSFHVQRGETYALVGESGCGKSATALSILRLVEPGRIVGGRLVFEERSLLDLSEKEMRRVRGGRIGIVFQEAAAALIVAPGAPAKSSSSTARRCST